MIYQQTDVGLVGEIHHKSEKQKKLHMEKF